MPAIELRTFGNTGLSVSRIGYGGMELAGPPRSPAISKTDAIKVLHAACDLGINYFDTSIDYGDSEEIIGAAFHKMRDRVILASKCGCVLGERTEGRSHVFSAENIAAGVRQSLGRLGTDYLDVVQLHGNPTREELERQGGLDALLDLHKSGMVRHIGLSTRKPFVQEFVDLDVLEVFQVPYSALQRQHEDIAQMVHSSGRAVVARGVVARGSVAKKWSAIPVGMKDGQAQDIWETAAIDELLAGQMSRIEFMIRFALSSGNIDVCLTGTTNIEHLEQNVQASGKGPLEKELYHEVLARLESAGSRPGEAEYVRGGPKPPTGTK